MEVVGYQMPTFPWLSDAPAIVAAVSEHIYLLFCIALTVQPDRAYASTGGTASASVD